MTTPTPVLFLSLAALLAFPLSGAEPFNSGSNGSYGPLNVTENTTLDLPPDGIFHCTTITVTTGATLRFNRNPLNTPVYLMAQGDVQVDGVIVVSGGNNDGRFGGKGGPGGFDGGDGGYGGTGFGGTGLGSTGHGPGVTGLADDRFASFAPGWNVDYGNALLSPLIGGSGGRGTTGNPGPGGGGGGGAILITSATKIVIGGAVQSDGGYGVAGGTGGGIRLVSPVVTGSGYLQTQGTRGSNGWEGGPGRTRIDCLDNQAVRTLRAVGSVSSRGSQMFVFPAVIPKLDITEAAGQAIPVPATGPVNIQLAQGAPTNHVVKVQARGFTNATPIRVVVIPNDRAPNIYDVELPKSDTAPATVSVDVVIPEDSVSRIYAWTR